MANQEKTRKGTGWRRVLCTSVQQDGGGYSHRDAKSEKRRPHVYRAGLGGDLRTAAPGVDGLGRVGYVRNRRIAALYN